MPPSERDRRATAPQWTDRIPASRAPRDAEAVRPSAYEPHEEHHDRDGATTLLIVVVVVLLLILVAAGSWLMFFRDMPLPNMGGTPVTNNASAGGSVAPTLAISPSALAATAGNSVVPGKAEDGRVTAIVASRQQSPRANGTTQAAFASIEPSSAQTLSGKLISVRVVARAATTNPTSRFALAFSAGTLGTSGWITFVPTSSFQPYDMRLRVPAGSNVGKNYVGVWADVLGLGHGLEVSEISVRILR